MLRADRPWVASASAPSSVSFRRASGTAARNRPRRGSERRRSRRLADAPRAALLADPYDVLGVPSDASPAEIKLAYRKRTKALHPDVNPSPDAADAFRRVNRAYAVVSDASRRSRFDLGRDLEARDDGFAPDGETRRRAAKGARRVDRVVDDTLGPTADVMDDRAIFDTTARRSNPFGVVADDAALRARGERAAAWRKARDAWTAWCAAWFVALTVAVPLGGAYWVAYGIAARLTDSSVPMLER